MASINFEKAVKKTLESGKIPTQYFLSWDELAELMSIAKARDFYDAITKAFCAGMQAGNHCTIDHGLKRL